MVDHVELVRYAGNALVIWAALVGTLSVIVHMRVRWWETEMGQHVMAYMATIAVVLDLAVVRLVFGDSDAFQVLRLIVFVGIPISMTWRLWLQIKARRSTP